MLEQGSRTGALKLFKKKRDKYVFSPVPRPSIFILTSHVVFNKKMFHKTSEGKRGFKRGEEMLHYSSVLKRKRVHTKSLSHHNHK